MSVSWLGAQVGIPFCRRESVLSPTCVFARVSAYRAAFRAAAAKMTSELGSPSLSQSPRENVSQRLSGLNIGLAKLSLPTQAVLTTPLEAAIVSTPEKPVASAESHEMDEP